MPKLVDAEKLWEKLSEYCYVSTTTVFRLLDELAAEQPEEYGRPYEGDIHFSVPLDGKEYTLVDAKRLKSPMLLKGNITAKARADDGKQLSYEMGPIGEPRQWVDAEQTECEQEIPMDGPDNPFYEVSAAGDSEEVAKLKTENFFLSDIRMAQRATIAKLRDENAALRQKVKSMEEWDEQRLIDLENLEGIIEQLRKANSDLTIENGRLVGRCEELADRIAAKLREAEERVTDLRLFIVHEIDAAGE